jgi:hypothetical protein
MREAGASRRTLVVAAGGAVALLAVVAAVVVWDPVGSLVRAVDLPLSDVADVPRWFWWALGKVKFVLLAFVALFVVVRELRRTRGA